MISLLLFLFSALLLIAEGWLLLAVFRVPLTRLERIALAFPIAAFVNVLIFFVLTVFGVPLSGLVVYGIHGLIIVVLLLVGTSGKHAAAVRKPPQTTAIFESLLRFKSFLKLRLWKKLIIVLLLVSIAIKLFYGISHSVILPGTFYFDSLSQWTHRAQVSYVDQGIAFDLNEERGVSKPQYPILVHSLQIFFMLPHNNWIDAVANGSTLLLSFMSLAAIALLLIRFIGPLFSLLFLWLLFSIPLLSFHLSQGYGDIHLLQYLLLSSVCLFMWAREGEGIEEERMRGGWLLLSGLFVAASAWAKQEGLFFGVVPWMFLMFLYGVFAKPSKIICSSPLLKPLIPFILSFPWLLFLFCKGFPISPHGGGDFQFGFHSEAIAPALKALFVQGSFGVHWYIVLLGLGFVLGFGWKTVRQFSSEFLIITWGLLTFLETLFIYLFTPNVDFLLNQQTFSRTMLIPLVLLLLGGCLYLKKHKVYFS